jgi:hypothetical protein
MAGGLACVLSECEDCLRITLGGSLSVGDCADHYHCVTAQADAFGCGRLLLDARAVADRSDIPSIFEFVVRAYPPSPGGRSTACVDKPENLVSARFFEHLMQNTGRSYRLFFDEAEALDWLRSDLP